MIISIVDRAFFGFAREIFSREDAFCAEFGKQERMYGLGGIHTAFENGPTGGSIADIKKKPH